jgi:hypothetical protein
MEIIGRVTGQLIAGGSGRAICPDHDRGHMAGGRALVLLSSSEGKSLMKKVRYAAGALGALGVMPTLGLVTPAATAATPPPARTGKTVSLAPATNAPCDARKALGGPKGNFSASIHFSRDIGCIGEVSGTLHNNTHTGLWMRVRSYANGHQVGPTRFNKSGHIHNTSGHHSITWSSSPFTRGIQQVCEAVVAAAASNTVINGGGPVCETTGF